MIAPTFRVGSLPLVNLLWRCLHRLAHPEMCFSNLLAAFFFQCNQGDDQDYLLQYWRANTGDLQKNPAQYTWHSKLFQHLKLNMFSGLASEDLCYFKFCLFIFHRSFCIQPPHQPTRSHNVSLIHILRHLNTAACLLNWQIPFKIDFQQTSRWRMSPTLTRHHSTGKETLTFHFFVKVTATNLFTVATSS